MFTQGTKTFGVWREGHSSNRRFKPPYPRYLLSAMALTSVISWIIVFINENINSRFFLHNQIVKAFPTVSGAVLSAPSTTSIEVSIFNTHLGHEVHFDGSHVFMWPKEKESIEKHLKLITERMEFLTLLTGETRDSIGKVTVWIDKSANFEECWELIATLSNAGFDSFELPMAWERARGQSVEKL